MPTDTVQPTQRELTTGELNILHKQLKRSHPELAVAIADLAAIVRNGGGPADSELTLLRRTVRELAAWVTGASAHPDEASVYAAAGWTHAHGPLPWRGHIGVRRDDRRPLSVNDAQIAARALGQLGGVHGAGGYRLDGWHFAHGFGSTTLTKTDVDGKPHEFKVPDGLVILNVTFAGGANADAAGKVSAPVGAASARTTATHHYMLGVQIDGSDPDGIPIELTEIVEDDTA